MNRSFYILTLSFWTLILGCTCLQGSCFLWIGPSIYTQPAFLPWFVISNIVYLTGTLLILKYYHYERAWLVFYTGAIAAVAHLCLTVLFGVLLYMGGQSVYYVPVLLLVLGTGILYGVALIFFSPAKAPWLKAAGVLLLLIGVVLISSVVWGLLHPKVQRSGALDNINKWASLASSLVVVLYIKHFFNEYKLLGKESETTTAGDSTDNHSVIIVLAVGITVTLGVMFVSDVNTSVYWGERIFDNAKRVNRLFESRVFVGSKGDTLFYHLLKPLNMDINRKYPLVISLPYGGQPPTDKVKQIEGAAVGEMLSTDENRKKYPAFIFVPNCPPGSGWGGIPDHPSVDSLTFEAISSLDNEPGIDVKRRYVSGVSRGGYGSWDFISKRPDLFAAAVPICGGGDPKLAPNAVNVAVWAFHGKNDKNVPVSGSRDIIAAIKKAGGHPKYTEFPHDGHNIWYQTSITPGLWDWLFAQKQQ